MTKYSRRGLPEPPRTATRSTASLRRSTLACGAALAALSISRAGSAQLPGAVLVTDPTGTHVRSHRAGQDSAAALFQAGRFAEAERLYEALLTRDPDHRDALVQLGRLALLSNRLHAAEARLRRALELAPGDAAATRLLAQVYYRQDRFAETARLVREGDELQARLLESFEGRRPYVIDGPGDIATLPFAQTDPIPVVKVRANGRDAYFIIDTGGSEVYLEPHFAEAIGAHFVSGSERAGFAGGQTRPVQKGRLDSLGLGQFTVRDVPVNIVDTKFIGRDQVAPGLEISGFVGTVLLYHFLPTIDYRNGALVLRRRTAAQLRQLETEAARGEHAVLPFWMAGDHFMVTWGRAHGSEPHLFFIDTGGAGIGFVPGPTFAKTAELAIPRDPGAITRAGDLEIVRFTTDVVSVGPVAERDVPSVLGPFPASLETSLGFRLAGIVSHAFFRRHALTIDFTTMRFFLRREP